MLYLYLTAKDISLLAINKLCIESNSHLKNISKISTTKISIDPISVYKRDWGLKIWETI